MCVYASVQATCWIWTSQTRRQRQHLLQPQQLLKLHPKWRVSFCSRCKESRKDRPV